MTAELERDLQSVASDPSVVWSIPRERATELLSVLAGAQAALAARLQAEGKVLREAPPDRGLTAEEASKLFGGAISEDWLRRNADRLPYARRISREQIVFSYQGIQQFLAAGLSKVTPSSPRSISGRERRSAP